MTAEYVDINNFQMSVSNKNGEELFNVSGLCMHSAYVVKEIAYKTENNILHITVFLSGVNKKGKSGSFNESIVIHPAVNMIVFGRDKQLLWKRDEF